MVEEIFLLTKELFGRCDFRGLAVFRQMLGKIVTSVLDLVFMIMSGGFGEVGE